MYLSKKLFLLLLDNSFTLLNAKLNDKQRTKEQACLCKQFCLLCEFYTTSYPRCVDARTLCTSYFKLSAHNHCDLRPRGLYLKMWQGGITALGTVPQGRTVYCSENVVFGIICREC